MLAEIPPGGLDERMDELTRTQPQVIDSVGERRATLSRRARLLRTIVFGLALILGIVTLLTVTGEPDRAPANSELVVSPTGHEPNRRNDDPNVSISWSEVRGAAGYWWSVVEDPFTLPEPVIRPSGNDRRVYFRFQGRAYFVLRTAHLVDGELRWSDAKIYGPILVGQQATSDVGVPGSSSGPRASGEPRSSAGASEAGGPGASGRSGPTASPDPRLAGQPGSCSGSSCGSPGEPGQPAQQPGGGGGGSRPSSDEGRPGEPGPSGAPG